MHGYYDIIQGLVEFEAGETKSSVEIPIMGKSPEAREFTVELESDPKVGLQRGARGRVTIGRNERAVVAIISNRGGYLKWVLCVWLYIYKLKTLDSEHEVIPP
uniref:Uncharacterized protein n=1 Tax=Ciona intestinalis TaxID=7719 RepID=H2XZ19_CIOIN